MKKYECDCGRIFTDPDGPIMCADSNHGKPKKIKYIGHGFMFFKCSKCNQPVDQPCCLSIVPRLKCIDVQSNCTLSDCGANWIEINYQEAFTLLGIINE